MSISPVTVTPSSFLTSPPLPLREYRRLPKPDITWLVEPLIPAEGVANLYGPSKSGKSYLAVDLAWALTTPTIDKWLTFDVKTHGPVLYVQLDTPRSLWIDRFDKLLKYNAYTNEPDGFHNCDIGQTPYPFNIGSLDAATYVRQAVDSIKPILVIIDTIREAHPGDENDSGHMQKIVASLVVACRPAAVLLLSHSRKLQYNDSGAVESNLIEDNRGSGYVSGRVDIIMGLRAKEGSNKGTLMYQGRAVPQGKCNLTKHTYGTEQDGCFVWEPEGTDPFQFQLASVALGEGILADKAKRLAALSGKSVDACKMAITRYKPTVH